MPIIKDCNEPLIDIKKVCPDIILGLSRERIQKEGSVYARKKVVMMLKKAISLLPNNLTFFIDDAWRPEYIQEKLFNEYIVYLSQKNPGWSNNRVKQEVKKYVHPSKGKYTSGHLTGGALDLRLVNKGTGKKIPMISRNLSFQENAKASQRNFPSYILKNRKIMSDVLQKVGFVNYPKEYRHRSYGDIYRAKAKKEKIAFYGIIKN